MTILLYIALGLAAVLYFAIGAFVGGYMSARNRTNTDYAFFVVFLWPLIPLAMGVSVGAEKLYDLGHALGQPRKKPDEAQPDDTDSSKPTTF